MTFKAGDRVRIIRGAHFGEVGTLFNRAKGYGEGLMISFDRAVRSAWTQEADEPEPGKSGWFVGQDELAYAKRTPSIADDLRLTPQAKTILRHLKAGKAITPLKAMTVYGVARLAGRIHELRNIGYVVPCELKHDECGHRYGRYTLVNG